MGVADDILGGGSSQKSVRVCPALIDPWSTGQPQQIRSWTAHGYMEDRRWAGPGHGDIPAPARAAQEGGGVHGDAVDCVRGGAGSITDVACSWK